MELVKTKNSEIYKIGEFIFYRESGCIDLVKVLENKSDNSEVRLRLLTVKNCNNGDPSFIDTEFNFYKTNSGGGFGMPSVSREYPSFNGCSVLKKHLERLGLNYNDILDYTFHNEHPEIAR